MLYNEMINYEKDKNLSIIALHSSTFTGFQGLTDSFEVRIRLIMEEKDLLEHVPVKVPEK